MKKLILASVLTLLCTGSAFAADSFSFGITLGIPVTPVSGTWDRSYPVMMYHRPVVVRDNDYRNRHDIDRDCRTVRKEYYDHGRVVTSRTMTVCDTRHEGWQFRHHNRVDRHYDGRHDDRH